MPVPIRKDDLEQVKTPVSSLDWDNYSSSPEFQGRKIPIVSTQYSDVASLTGRLFGVSEVLSDTNSEHSVFITAKETVAAGMENYQKRSDLLLGSKQRILDEISDNPAVDIEKGMEARAKEDLDKLLGFMRDFRTGVRAITNEFKSEVKELDVDWEEIMKEVVEKTLAHKKEVTIKLSSMNPASILDEYQKQCLEIKMKKLEIEQQRIVAEAERDKKVEQKTREEAKRLSDEGLAQAKTKLLSFRDDYDTLMREIGQDSTPHSQRTNEEISSGMRNLNRWEKVVARMTASYLDFDRLAELHGGGERAAAKQENNFVKNSYETEKEGLEEEDRERGLYTNLTVVGEKLDYPKFGGADGEDYEKFHEKVTKVFKHNKVAKSDQLDKLRKCLSGFALTLVPETTEGIEKALSTLKSAFGDPEKVLANRLKKLKSSGDMPMEKIGSKSLFSRRKEWFLNIEGVIYDIIQLGKKDDDLAYEAYSKSTFNFILSLFPLDMMCELERVEGTRGEKMEKVLEKMAEFRNDARKAAKIYGDKVPPGAVDTGKKDKVAGIPDFSGSKQSRTVSQTDLQLKRRPDCRICKQLETDGYGERLFEDHFSNEATGCPMFIKMNTEERNEMVFKAKLCGRCLDVDVTVSGNIQFFEHRKNCKGPPSEFSCGGDRCKFHIWVCKVHAARNSSKMRVQVREMLDKGLTMGMVNIPVVNTAATNTITQLKTIDQAVRQLVEEGIKKPGCKWVNPPPKGSPMFLFARCKGKKNGANLFFDKGCGTAVFRKGIPGGELEGVKLAKGKIPIGGVGGIEIDAEEDWMVSLEKEDGQRQLVQGLAIQRVTVDFPLVDTTKAVAEIKADTRDTWVRDCRVPEKLGGVTDALIGIQYDLIHPESVHTLANGLTLYRSKLAPHEPGLNAAIGGPHTSFDFCCKTAGGAARVVTLFTQQLQMYRTGDWTAPRLTSYPMSEDERDFAKRMNECDGFVEGLTSVKEAEVDTEELLEEFDEVLSLVEEVAAGLGGADSQQRDVVVPSLTCIVCGLTATPDVWLGEIIEKEGDTGIDPSEKVKKVKENWLQLEAGLDIEYRCVKCRDCVQCKNADQSEKISLREEAEMQMVAESVNLDWEQGRIICTLPLRGAEKDFLTTNKSIALKVLDQQCRKWHKDEVNKPLILAAFEKLYKTGDTRFLNQMSEDELSKFAEKEVQYYIPWRVVFQDSVTTPVRTVLDGSSNTKARADGTGGRSLNDLVCKGKIRSLNLLRLLLRFSIGLFAMTGDLSQFYYSCKLKPEQWNLQRFLFRDNLDPDGELREGVIGALIYGIKCVSAQTEHAMEEIAKAMEQDYPELAKLIRMCRYVDDMGESSTEKEFLKMVVKQADEVFKKIGLSCKGWTWSGEDPPEKIMKAGCTVSIAGQRWTPKVDCIEVPIPDLHFGVRRRGRVDDKVPRFKGTKDDMEKFIPLKLTRRKIASKVASIYDLLGKLAPILAGLKVDLSEVVKLTIGWDDPVTLDVRAKWVENFWKIERMRGIRFNRARMPVDAIDSNMRMITVVDAAMSVVMVGIWVGFKRKNGEWSCQHLIGRALLAKSESTIPKNELQGLTVGANLQWVVRQALNDWVHSSILVGDSEVALCWVTAENKPLAIFQRNRAIQVRRSMDLDDIYHVRTEFNPSDVGTRPGKVTLEDVGPGSRWEEGDDWMKQEIENVLEMEIIKPAKGLRIKDEEESEFRQGLIFERVPEILTRGHVINERRVGLLEERANLSQYLVLPTKFTFVRVVRITSYVMMFVTKARKGRRTMSRLLFEGKLWFSVFSADAGRTASSLADHRGPDEHDLPEPVQHLAAMDMKCVGMFVSENLIEFVDQARAEKLVDHFTRDMHRDHKETFVTFQAGVASVGPEDRFINMALLYLYRKATDEVKHFCNMNKINKIAVEKEGVLLSKGRILDGMNYRETGELVNLDLGDLGIKTHLPLLERFSPMAYSVADHVHWDLAKHRGVETCARLSMENVSIMQAHSLFREMSTDCMLCKQKRRRFLEVEMGPISDSQLSIAPPFWMCQVDLFGPITVVVPGYERETRNRRILEAKCWIMTAVCPTTRLVNLQTLESSKAAGWLDGFTRMACEVGCPSHVFCDRDSAGMSGFDIAELEMRDLQLKLFREKKISFSLCPVSGHDRHGHVERVIRSVQESFEDCGLKKQIIHATGLQTLCKLVENQYNNLPLGYHYDRDADNSPLLKMLTPNMLRVGKINKRSMDGPIRMPKDRLEILAKVVETFDSWFKIWAEAMVPKLMFQPKWFKTEKELKPGDLVYFPRTESVLDKKWIKCVVDTVERGRDGLIRMVDIRYKNANENQFQVTSRSIRKVVKLWGIEDMHLAEDLAELGRKFKAAQEVMNEQIHADYDSAAPEVTGEEDDMRLLLPDEEQLDCPENRAGDRAGDNQSNGGVVSGENVGENFVHDDDLLFQLEDETRPSGEDGLAQHQGGGDPDLRPGGDDQDPLDVPATNTRSRKKCAKCCCLAHHSLSAHLQKRQLGEVPPSTCQLEDYNIFELFTNLQGDKITKESDEDNLEGILWAAGSDIIM